MRRRRKIDKSAAPARCRIPETPQAAAIFAIQQAQRYELGFQRWFCLQRCHDARVRAAPDLLRGGPQPPPDASSPGKGKFAPARLAQWLQWANSEARPRVFARAAASGRAP